MKVAGFSFVRNAIKFDYPIVEAIESILPLCDAFYIAVGKSEDETLQKIQAIQSDKIRIIETVWDDRLREGGHVLAIETNKCFDAISDDFDWCFYIQGDEVVHEADHDAIRKAMQTQLNNTEVEGLLFKYLHFYGSYDFIGDSRKWYRNEVRIVRNNKAIRSYKDAQGFRINGRKLKVKAIDARIFHYGWVKPPEKQMEKQRSFHKMWHNDQWVKQKLGDKNQFDYSTIDSLKHFTGSHPKVIQNRITKSNWTFDFDPTKKNMRLKDLFLYIFEKYTGHRIGEYKNFRTLN